MEAAGSSETLFTADVTTQMTTGDIFTAVGTSNLR
jgi:hypothetical protein